MKTAPTLICVSNGTSSPPLTLVVRPNTKETPEPVKGLWKLLAILLDDRTGVAWGPTYQVLYPAVTVGRVAPLASVADITASWCHSSELCWLVLLDGHTWQMVKCPIGVGYLVSWREG